MHTGQGQESPHNTHPRPTKDTPVTGCAWVPLMLNSTLTLLVTMYWFLSGGDPVPLYHRYSSWVVEL